jgi:hypothetical protein
MGDLPKPSDDASWTELERSFFASGPPEDPQPLGEAPRLDDLFPTLPPQPPARERFAWLRSSVAAGWRRTTLVFAAARAHARRKIQAGAAGLVAVLSIGSINGRRVAIAAAGSMVAAGLFAAIVASRNGVPTSVATAKTEAPAGRPAVTQATAPVPTLASGAPAQPDVPSTADVRSPRADASHRPPPARRKPARSSSPATSPLMTASIDRETYWAREGQTARVRQSTPLFSR